MTVVLSLSSQGKDHEVHPTSGSTVLPETPVLVICTHADQPFTGKNFIDRAGKVYSELWERRSKTHLYEPVETQQSFV